MATDCLISQWQHGGMTNFLRQWREARGLTLEQVGSAIGSDKTQISKLEKGDRKLSVQWLERLATFYGVDPGELLKTPGERTVLAKLADTHGLESNVEAGPAMGSITSLPLDVPVYGTAVGGNHGDFSLNGQVVDYVRRPPGVLRNRSVFCVFLRGDSMEPRLDNGELIYVNPSRPAKPGDDVLVELKPLTGGEPGPAYIKRLESQTPTKLVLKQFNPPAKIEIPLAKVLRISPLMRNKELMGV